ncbi:uncharacterized protein AB9X84_023643 [Acanthopagrus schlegelii]
MATFVSLATCHHCPLVSSRRGLVYKDSLSVLSRNLRAPGGLHRPPITGQQGHNKHSCRLTRTKFPESIALARSRPAGLKQLVLTHLRKLLTTSPAQPRSLHLPV